MIKIGVIGDSDSDEYGGGLGAETPTAEDNRPANNWVELLMILRALFVDFGVYGNFNPGKRRHGYAFNWSRTGAVIADMIGSAVSLAAQIISDGIQLVIFRIGTNNFSPHEPGSGSSSNYYHFYNSGHYSTTPSIKAELDQVIADYQTMVNSLTAQGLSKFLFTGIPDWSSSFVVLSNGSYQNASRRQRVTDATAYVNAGIQAIATAEGAPYLSIDDLNVEVVSVRGADYPSGTQAEFGGQVVDLLNTGDGLFASLNDGHAGTIASGFIGNRFIAEIRRVYGSWFDVPMITDQELLQQEALNVAGAPRITNVSATHTGGNVTVIWDTDLSCDSQVDYGPSALNILSNQTIDAAGKTSHSLVFPGDGSTYFRIRSTTAGKYDQTESDVPVAPAAAPIALTASHSLVISHTATIDNTATVPLAVSHSLVISHTATIDNTATVPLTASHSLVISHAVTIDNTATVPLTASHSLVISHSATIGNTATVPLAASHSLVISHSATIDNTASILLTASHSLVISHSATIDNGVSIPLSASHSLIISHSATIGNTAAVPLAASHSLIISHSATIGNTAAVPLAASHSLVISHSATIDNGVSIPLTASHSLVISHSATISNVASVPLTASHSLVISHSVTISNGAAELLTDYIGRRVTSTILFRSVPTRLGNMITDPKSPTSTPLFEFDFTPYIDDVSDTISVSTLTTVAGGVSCTSKSVIGQLVQFRANGGTANMMAQIRCDITTGAGYNFTITMKIPISST